MYHCVTVWTDRPKVFNRVDLVLRTYRSQGLDVVNMNIPRCLRAIDRSEINAADCTSSSVDFDAASAGYRVSLVRIHGDVSNSALDERILSEHFIGQRIAGCGIPAGEKTNDDLITELPHEPAFVCPSAGRDDVPPLELAGFKALRMGPENRMDLAPDPSNRSIHLYDGRKAKDCSKLASAGRVIGCI